MPPTDPRSTSTESSSGPPDERPNVVFFLADDLGYGSVGAYGADPEVVRTPTIDRLAEEGTSFTDAYTASAVCSPTRYGVLMGRYPWRTEMKSGVVDPNESLLPDPDRMSLAHWLQERGYATATVGKWHLGYDSAHREPEDWLDGLDPGPLEMGYDYHFDVPQNHGDLSGVYVENQQIWKLDSRRQPIPYSRTFYGPPYIGFDAHQRVNKQVMETITEKAVDWLDRQSGYRPFFLNFNSVAVHKPITPSDAMRGESDAGPYGDFVQDIDRSVRRIVEKLEEMGELENTIFVFTSDNGGVVPWDGESCPEQAAIERGLEINGTLRGRKHTIWEGGVRVPYIVRWPSHVPAGETSDALISLNDTFATVAEIVSGAVPSAEEAAPDSFSFREPLVDPEGGDSERASVVVADVDGMLALRRGQWKYVEGTCPDDSDADVERSLYHLGADRSETTNLLSEYSELADLFQGELDAVRDAERSRTATGPSSAGGDLQRAIDAAAPPSEVDLQ